jgi:hypothetical protein
MAAAIPWKRIIRERRAHPGRQKLYFRDHPLTLLTTINAQGSPALLTEGGRLVATSANLYTPARGAPRCDIWIRWVQDPTPPEGDTDDST